MYSPSPPLELTSSAEISDLFYCRKVFRNQDLSTRCAHCYWGIITSSLSQWTELGNRCMYTNSGIQTYGFISVFICKYMCLYFYNNKFIFLYKYILHYYCSPSAVMKKARAESSTGGVLSLLHPPSLTLSAPISPEPHTLEPLSV